MTRRAATSDNLFTTLPQDGPEEPTFSVSEINEMVQAVLRDSFPKTIWVRGEIQGFDLRKHRDTVSFNLAEKSPNSDDVEASVTAIIFKPDRMAIEALLRRAENAFELRDGIEVRFKVDVDMWVKAGRYQLRVRGIDPTYTLGRIAQNRRRILEQLTQKGLLEQNKQLAVPLVPLRIGLIGAQGSAGLNDFLTHLRQSGFAFRVTLINAAMQGSAVEAEVSRAVAHFSRTGGVDAVVITRGGGAATDLSWFDRYGLAETIAMSKLPVLTGLGHTHDTSVCDLVAHTDLKTPTDAAQFLINRVRTFLDGLDQAGRKLARHAEDRLATEHDWLSQGAQQIVEAATQLMHGLGLWLADRQRDLARRGTERLALETQFLRGATQRLSPERATQLVQRERARLTDLRSRLATQTGRLTRRAREELLRARQAWTFDRMNRRLSRETQWLAHTRATIAVIDPAKTLKRGFSILRTQRGTIITTVRDVAVDDVVQTQVSDGTITSRVRDVATVTEESQGG